MEALPKQSDKDTPDPKYSPLRIPCQYCGYKASPSVEHHGDDYSHICSNSKNSSMVCVTAPSALTVNFRTLEVATSLKSSTIGAGFQFVNCKAFVTKRGDVYISGRLLSESHAKLEGDLLLYKAQMILLVTDFAMVEVQNEMLFLIGGAFRFKEFTDACQLYDIPKNKWKEAPKLNMQRVYHCAIVFDDSEVIVYGGYGQYSLLNFEKIKLDNDYAGEWILLEAQVDYSKAPAYFGFSLKLNEEEFMVFGGCKANGGIPEQNLIFNRQTLSILHRPFKLKPIIHYMPNSAFSYGDMVYISSRTDGLHMLKIRDDYSLWKTCFINLNR